MFPGLFSLSFWRKRDTLFLVDIVAEIFAFLGGDQKLEHTDILFFFRNIIHGNSSFDCIGSFNHIQKKKRYSAV